MGSAPVRKGFESRALSSQRRGSYVGPGMPGVYAVRRGRSVQQSASAPSGPAPADGWVQPDDVEATITLANWHWTQHDSPPSEDGYVLFYSNTEQARAFKLESGFERFETVCPVASLDNCPATPVSPDPPVGMTVEYEDTDGVLLTARLRGSIRNAADSGTPTAGVWEIPEATLDPGQDTLDMSGHIGPTFDTAGGANVFLTTVVDTMLLGGDWTVQAFETPYQDFPASLRVGWKISSTAGAFETGLTYPDAFVTDFWGVPADLDAPLWGSTNRFVDYTYRPPRYRFV